MDSIKFNASSVLVRRVRITKINELPDALYPNNIPEGQAREGFVYAGESEKPKAGECFIVWGTKTVGLPERFSERVGGFRTSTVQEVISDTVFRTYNSIYQLEFLGEQEELFTA